MSLIWLSVSSGISAPGYVLAIMVVTQKTNGGKILPLVTEPPIRSTATDRICDQALIRSSQCMMLSLLANAAINSNDVRYAEAVRCGLITIEKIQFSRKLQDRHKRPIYFIWKQECPLNSN